LNASRTRVAGLARALQTVSPLATLERGYAIVTGPDDKLLTDVDGVRPGDAIRVQVRRGKLTASVSSIAPGTDDNSS
jgi:exodeoxyribonuclease VII large subunit